MERRAALTDFGSCEPEKTTTPLHRYYTTAEYRAPELWPKGCGDGGHRWKSSLCREADIWSFGCTVWELEVGELFFRSSERHMVEHLVSSFSAHWSATWRKAARGREPSLVWPSRLERARRWVALVKMCMIPFPSKRPANLGAVVDKVRLKLS